MWAVLTFALFHLQWITIPIAPRFACNATLEQSSLLQAHGMLDPVLARAGFTGSTYYLGTAGFNLASIKAAVMKVKQCSKWRATTSSLHTSFHIIFVQWESSCPNTSHYRNFLSWIQCKTATHIHLTFLNLASKWEVNWNIFVHCEIIASM